MSAATVELGTWYPDVPPALPGETDDQYTNRLTGAAGTGRPFNHARNRQCSIGYHDECSDPDGERCKCPCHADLAPPLARITHGIARAAEVLADLYYLPAETTASRVMVAAVSAIENGAVADKTELRHSLSELYDTKISDGFVTDVVAILADQGVAQLG